MQLYKRLCPSVGPSVSPSGDSGITRKTEIQVNSSKFVHSHIYWTHLCSYRTCFLMSCLVFYIFFFVLSCLVALFSFTYSIVVWISCHLIIFFSFYIWSCSHVLMSYRPIFFFFIIDDLAVLSSSRHFLFYILHDLVFFFLTVVFLVVESCCLTEGRLFIFEWKEKGREEG